MIICIILMALFFVLLLCVLFSPNMDSSDTAASCGAFLLFAFIAMLLITIVCGACARENKVIYDDMAKNPQYYSLEDLRKAHKAIQGHKAHQGHWTSFYNGYEFPEIDVTVIDKVDNIIHIVK